MLCLIPFCYSGLYGESYKIFNKKDKKKMKTNNVFCRGEGFKMIIVCIISLIVGFTCASYFETSRPRSITTMSDIANSNTTNLVSHLPIVRIGSGIR